MDFFFLFQMEMQKIDPHLGHVKLQNTTNHIPVA